MRNISKTLLAVALGSFISGNALASDQSSGKITFKGVIIDAPCNIAPDSIDKEIELGQFTTAVMNVNKKSTAVPVDINLENCQLDAADETATPVTKVDVTFSSTATDATDTSLMSNTYAGGAQNVGVRLLDNAETPITLGTAQTVDLSAGSATQTLHFKAQMEVVDGKTATAGQVESTANYVLLYK
ncbi:fimbrial protein [Enterobacter cloacae]|uniref:fimbrial protein n=1 Tax=Enterobacter cloacae complex TaxID=354276 RepID=UPI00293B308C|nr:fimbrial protein [Enterobacter cloacae subsp. cloacae]HEC5295526.1 fimbrial protein [Enterobacter cloacae]